MLYLHPHFLLFLMVYGYKCQQLCEVVCVCKCFSQDDHILQEHIFESHKAIQYMIIIYKTGRRSTNRSTTTVRQKLQSPKKVALWMLCGTSFWGKVYSTGSMMYDTGGMIYSTGSMMYDTGGKKRLLYVFVLFQILVSRLVNEVHVINKNETDLSHEMALLSLRKTFSCSFASS